MIKFRKKYLKLHLCPECHKVVVWVRHPKSQRCSTCHKRYRRHAEEDNAVKRARRKYNNSSYQTQRRHALNEHGYCALCGSTNHLTCHHTVNTRTGEWQGKHLTVLCENCHQIWETKVNILRSKYAN